MQRWMFINFSNINNPYSTLMLFTFRDNSEQQERSSGSQRSNGSKSAHLHDSVCVCMCVCVCVCVCVGPLIATFWIFDEITAWDKAFCWVGTGAKPPLYGGNELMFCLLCSQLIVHLYVIKRAMLSVPVLTVRDSPINTAIMQSIDASVFFVIR